MQENGPQLGLRERFESFHTWGLFFLRAFALPTEVFFRHSFGRNYIGMQGLVAALGIPFWMLLFREGTNPGPLLLFEVAFLLMCFIHRVTGGIRRMRGYVCHSRYTGTPYLMWIFRGWDEVFVKQWIEPGLGWFIGGFLLPVSVPLGGFIMASALTLCSCVQIDTETERQRMQDLVDAHFENANLLESFGRMRGGGSFESNLVKQARDNKRGAK